MKAALLLLLPHLWITLKKNSGIALKNKNSLLLLQCCIIKNGILELWIIMFILELIKNMFKSKQTVETDKNNKGICTPSSIDEAAALIECIRQGLLPDTFERDPHANRPAFPPNSNRGAFIDHLGNTWDVKTLKTHSLYGTPIFNLNNISRTIKKELDRPDKHLILNISKLPDFETQEIYKCLKLLPREKLKKIIILNRSYPRQSKTPEQLLQFLEQLA